MRVAVVTSNSVTISPGVKKGTEIFVRILLNHLTSIRPDFKITAFASHDSVLPVPIESLDLPATSRDINVPHEKYVIFELALIAKAFAMQDKFDIFHINIGDGDIVLPFAKDVKKPILITIHHLFEEEYVRKYFSLFKDLDNVYFIPISNAVKKYFPDAKFLKTIYHGIEEKEFTFDKDGGRNMLWAGRGIPSKGLSNAIEVARNTNHPLTACVIRKATSLSWLDKLIDSATGLVDSGNLSVKFDVERKLLVHEFRKSKVFLFPIEWEEPFGLVLIEAMACGTPVIAFARGSVSEVIKDGVTGFLVNPSIDDIRGNFIIKKTGIDGLLEAVEKLYSLSDNEYSAMRMACRKHVEENFTADRMAEEYARIYDSFAAQ